MARIWITGSATLVMKRRGDPAATQRGGHASAEQDLDVELPLRRLHELVDAGVVGDVSTRHFSIMGYILDAADLVTDTAPQLAEAMADDHVDLALLVPS